MSMIDRIKQKARAGARRIALSEGDEPRTIRAAAQVLAEAAQESPKAEETAPESPKAEETAPESPKTAETAPAEDTDTLT